MAGLGEALAQSWNAVNGNKARTKIGNALITGDSLNFPSGKDLAHIAGQAADFAPVIGGAKGAYEEGKAGNYGMAALNGASALADVFTGGMGGALLKGGLIGAVLPGGMNKARAALEAAQSGSRAKPFHIAELTKKQFDDVNALRAANGAPPLPSRTIEYVGRHHNESRAADGYETKDMLKQLYSGLRDDSVASADRYGRVSLRQPVVRHDGYGNKVNDLVTLNVDGNKVYAEALSAIPQGDKWNTPLAQMKKAGEQPPEFLSHPISDGSRRMDGYQPLPSLVTEHDVRKWIAQDNSVKELGLPANNTAMQRSDAMNGLDSYHGTASDVQQLDPRMFGSSTGAESAKRAWWAVDEPNTARGYAEYAATQAPIKRLLNEADRLEKKGDWDGYDNVLGQAEALEAKFADSPLNGQNIMPLKIIPNNPRVMDAAGAEFTDVEGGVNNFLRQAKIGKNDTAIIQNLSDDVAFNGRPATHYGVLDPSVVRSRFAAFDPMRRHEADLLGYADPRLLAGIAAGGVAATQIPEEYKSALANAFGGQ